MESLALQFSSAVGSTSKIAARRSLLMVFNMAFRMRQDNRNKVDRVAWISVGDGLPLRNCTLIDISDSGAKLAFEEVGDIPDIFSFGCRVTGIHATRAGLSGATQNKIGVQFSLDDVSARI